MNWPYDGDFQECWTDPLAVPLYAPRMDGIEATRRIAAEFPRVRVIALSMFDDAAKRALMLEAGAAGYVAKGSDPEALLAAIRDPGPPVQPAGADG